jgi:hypothetical protein
LEAVDSLAELAAHIFADLVPVDPAYLRLRDIPDLKAVVKRALGTLPGGRFPVDTLFPSARLEHAARLLHDIIWFRRHIFGNRAVAWALAETYLMLGEQESMLDDSEAARLVKRIESGELVPYEVLQLMR